jgi:hypothetical protein
MAIMNGIEGAAKKRDTARMMFGGGAVRLRGGQCFSQRSFQPSVSVLSKTEQVFYGNGSL